MQKRSPTLKRLEISQKFLELNNAQYCGDCQNFTFEGFGFVLWDDGNFFVGTFHRDQIQGIGVLYTKQREMIYSNFYRRNCDGITIYRNQDIIWCGILQNSQPQEPTYTFTRKTSTWICNENPEVRAQIQLPKLPLFIDQQLQEAIHRMLNLDFQFQIPKYSQSFTRFKILRPPPFVKGIFESQDNSDEESLKPILDDLNQYQRLTYLGFVRLQNQNIMPYGVGVYIDPSTLKIHLAGSFVNGWLDGLGIMKYNDGSSVIGCFRHSMLKGDCLVYDASSQKHYILQGDKIQQQEQQINGTLSQTQQVCHQIHKSSIYYMDRSLNFKKLSGLNIRSFIEMKFVWDFNTKENHPLQNKYSPPKSKKNTKKNNLIKNISLILSKGRIPINSSNKSSQNTESQAKPIRNQNISQKKAKNRIKTQDSRPQKEISHQKLRISKDQETQTNEKLKEVLDQFMNMANIDHQQQNVTDFYDSLNPKQNFMNKQEIMDNQVPKFTNNKLSNLFKVSGPQLSNSINRSRIHLSTTNIKQNPIFEPLQKSLNLNQSMPRSKQKIFENSNHSILILDNSRSRSRKKIFDMSDFPMQKSQSPMSLHHFSPSKISPPPLSPLSVSLYKISPKTKSPTRQRIFSKKIFD